MLHMEPTCDSSPVVPMGWTTWKTGVKKDGSKAVIYCCPATGQQFHSFANLMRYVSYAQREQLGMYQLANKSVKKASFLSQICHAPKFKTTGMLSLPKKPSSNSNSSAPGLILDPKPSTSGGSSDKEEVPDYLLESEINAASNQKLNEE